jgi:hypothetical protein
MMTKRNRNIKNIFIKLQLGTNIMANEVKTPIQNYFEGEGGIVTSPCAETFENLC